MPSLGRSSAVLTAAATLFALSCVLIGGAAATSGCVSSQSTSADGTIAYGSACADEIVITSPRVEKVVAGKGDDVIYANPEVERVYGGEGDDVIFGDLPEGERNLDAAHQTPTGPGYEPPSDVDYETAPPPEPEADVRAGRIRPAGERSPGDRVRTHGARASDAAASASSLSVEGRGHRRPLAAVSSEDCDTTPCYAGDGSQEIFGGPGADQIFGQRGNDTLHGEAGADILFGGIGDDIISGGDGFDSLSGGLGTDTLDGNDGTDHIRGDGTVDVLRDTGSTGEDTLSYSTAVTPGFTGAVPIDGFTPEGNDEERGVHIRLDGVPAPCGTQSCNNDARYGGGGDEISVAGIENVIGSPFADYIVGSEQKNSIFGGGGADAVIGNGGNDVLYGGAGVDFIDGGNDTDTIFDSGANNCVSAEYPNGCTGSAAAVSQRNPSLISVGRMITTLLLGGYNWESFYVVGSSQGDNVSVKRVPGNPFHQLIFTAEPGSAQFDTSSEALAGCEYAPTVVKCRIPSLATRLDSITLAGMAGDDRFTIAGEPEWEATTTPTLIGGQGNDTLIGSGQTEDVLIDGVGEGNDHLFGFAFDDALLNNEGADRIQGGLGSDLLVSASTCDGDVLQGAENKKGDKTDVNNASWSQLPPSAGAIVADLARKKAGSQYVEYGIDSNDKDSEEGKRRIGGPACPSGALDLLYNIDDLEGSAQDDAFYGDSRSNNLLGRLGKDMLFGRGGNDRIAAKDGVQDKLGGGGGEDLCMIDEGLDQSEGCEP